ncbi:MAG: 16S rRNA (cytidine(1402)-2'-O)-methyltransferase [Candidatus Endonucleobacter bathymodioli]|uniref:Ribosomal RNA small subunit methyltransferase I n=1 Tax=Candidatus Endonucleibacter bathymodioli TaxID=539814 RepID=A0AA90NTZ5_9GAMM|nr:16S rRNA (cytidine(1402)-2'-O)-methyltransferase [Candidatus Endonucleobacter bathymodioli]
MLEPSLYIVATPIGNLGDMTSRAVDILKRVDVIAAEDTRHSRRLLNYFGIETRLISCHEHNERQKTEKLLIRLQEGESVALISDAGTPLISDPGYFLVRTVREAGIKVVPIPGVCAIIAALSVSGLATNCFYFAGFLPAKSSKRREKLAELSEMKSTWGFYESTHRICESLDDCLDMLGEQRYVVLAREITKTFETVIAGTVGVVRECLANDSDQCRGEFVVLVEGSREKPNSFFSKDTERLLLRLLQDLSIKKATAIVADITGHRKKELYDFVLTLKNK